MASLIEAVLYLLHETSAAAIGHRAYGTCQSFDIPVTVTSNSSVYDIRRVDNNIDATAWAVERDTWSFHQGILENTTTTGTFNIHAQFCIPPSPKPDILQIATHGLVYDHRYWDAKPELGTKYSYVNNALAAGYPILTYDRLSTGLSSKPDAYRVVQAPLQLEDPALPHDVRTR